MCNAAVGDISSVLDSHCAQLNSLGFYVTDVAQQPRPRVKKEALKKALKVRMGATLYTDPRVIVLVLFLSAAPRLPRLGEAP